MSNPTVFYSWQSDLPRATTRDIIRDASAAAVTRMHRQMSLEESPRLDHDTLGESGTPAISETIFRKIKRSAIFLADVTLVGETTSKDGRKVKRLSNPNVLIELGFAAAVLGWDRIVLVMNKHKQYGSPDWLPFDLRYRRFPLTFELGPQSKRRQEVIQSLADELERAIRTCLAAEYDRVNDVLSRLSSFTRSLILKHGGNTQFWETEADNKVLSRLDLAISQLLELDVIECVQAATDSGLAYAWTYLGRQCALRLGVRPIVPKLPSSESSAPGVIVDMSSYEAIGEASSGYRVDVSAEQLPLPHSPAAEPAKHDEAD